MEHLKYTQSEYAKFALSRLENRNIVTASMLMGIISNYGKSIAEAKYSKLKREYPEALQIQADVVSIPIPDKITEWRKGAQIPDKEENVLCLKNGNAFIGMYYSILGRWGYNGVSFDSNPDYWAYIIPPA